MTTANKMRTPRQYFSERYPWLRLVDSLAVAIALVLVIVAIWPRSRLVIDLVLITAIPGLIAAIAWGLTFWQKARVLVGRLKLRYKSVRRIAGLTALFCLPYLLLQQASIYLRGPNILREPAVDVSGLSEPYPKLAKWKIRVVVAIAHLEGDDGHKIEGQLRDALTNLDPRLPVTPIILNRTITISGRPQRHGSSRRGRGGDRHARLFIDLGWGEGRTFSSRRPALCHRVRRLSAVRRRLHTR